MRRLIALWLRRNGFLAFEAGGAVQGLACLRRHRRAIDLVIIDVVGTHGLDLASEMGRDFRTTPILYISGYIDSLAVQAIGWRSPESLLLKPFPRAHPYGPHSSSTEAPCARGRRRTRIAARRRPAATLRVSVRRIAGTRVADARSAESD
jgi:CheY-like chemotaxis protein